MKSQVFFVTLILNWVDDKQATHMKVYSYLSKNGRDEEHALREASDKAFAQFSKARIIGHAITRLTPEIFQIDKNIN